MNDTDTPPELIEAAAMADPALYARLMTKAACGAPSECWEWTACVTPAGYGAIQLHGKKVGAHRAMWQAVHGPLADASVYVCHRCDNPRCINPAHLFSGTAADNNRDRANKQRSHRPAGEANPAAKFSDEQVATAKAMFQAGSTAREVAAAIGAKFGTVCRWLRVGKVQVGRSGERNGRAKLTHAKVEEIKRRLAAGEPRAAIASAMGVSKHPIYLIATGKGWAR